MPPLEDAFVRAMEVYGRIRRRDGVSWWRVFRDLEHGSSHVRKTFGIGSTEYWRRSGPIRRYRRYLRL